MTAPKQRVTKARRAETEAAHLRHVERTYGITAEMYQRLLSYQGGKCWGCRRATGAARRLCVDHDHRTGEVRMILCNRCNQLLGHFRDNPISLIRLGLALVDPPSRAAWGVVGRPGWDTPADLD